MEGQATRERERERETETETETETDQITHQALPGGAFADCRASVSVEQEAEMGLSWIATEIGARMMKGCSDSERLADGSDGADIMVIRHAFLRFFVPTPININAHRKSRIYA